MGTLAKEEHLNIRHETHGAEHVHASQAKKP
jgi:hypothetical protein